MQSATLSSKKCEPFFGFFFLFLFFIFFILIFNIYTGIYTGIYINLYIYIYIPVYRNLKWFLKKQHFYIFSELYTIHQLYITYTYNVNIYTRWVLVGVLCRSGGRCFWFWSHQKKIYIHVQCIYICIYIHIYINNHP